MKRLPALTAVLFCLFGASTALASGVVVKTVTPSHSPATVTLSRGAELRIYLADNNPSTGYAWIYSRKPSPRVLTLVSDTTASPPASTPGSPAIAGAAQPRTIIYRATGKGTTKLVLQDRPPGRGDANEQALVITVHVK